MTTAAAPSRAPLFVGVGCLGCLGLLCVGSVVAFFGWRGLVGMSASAHAVRFLQTIQRRDYAEGYAIALSRYDTDRGRLADFTTCIGATPLGTMTNFTCSDSDVTLDQSRAEVTCTLTTPTSPTGTTEMTVVVNDPVEHPYNGFLWFSPDAVVGPAWHADSCASWSGRDYVEEPPAGRVRP